MNLFFARLGLAGLLPVLGLFPFVVLLALPVVDLGVFRQVETVAAAIHLLSAACALCLLLVSLGDARILRPAKSLAVLAPAALGAVALAAAPLVDSPERTLVGSMEHGVGAAWFLELSVVILAATVLRRERPRLFAGVAYAAAGSVALCLALQAMRIPYGTDVFVPYDFREFLGVSGPIAAAALLALGGRRASYAGLALAAASLALSGNRAALLAVLVAVPAYLALRRLRPSLGRRALASGAVLAALGGLAGVAATPMLWERLAVSSGADRGTVQSADPVDWASVQTRPYGTVWGRGVSAGMVLRDLASSPERMLAGKGFGTFETVAVERKREAPGRRIVAPVETAAATYWDGDQKAKFHSHNLLLESVLGAGIGGGLAWLAFLGGIALSARPRALPGALLLLATLAVTGSFWFLVNSALPLVAVAVAAVGPTALRRAEPAPKPGAAAAGATAALALGFVGFAGLAAVQSASARTIMVERYFAPLPWGPLRGGCVGFQAVGVPDRQLNVNLYRMFVRMIEDKGAAGADELVKRRNTAANLSCLMRRFAAERNDVEAMEASLDGRYRLWKVLGDRGGMAGEILGPDIEEWPNDIERFLARAPGRTDVIVPFVAWAENSGNGTLVLRAERLLSGMRDEDPVKSLLSAAIARANGDAEGHAKLIVRALDLGLANLTPLPAQMARGVRQQVAR
jgi:hypothetical protein